MQAPLSKIDWKYVYAFDPGRITGFAEGVYGPDFPLEIGSISAVELDRFVPFVRSLVRLDRKPSFVISEGFKARTNNNFVADDTPKKVEGMLEALFPQTVIYRPRTKKAQVPDEILKEHGLWQTGKTVGWEDGRDANDAIIHLLGFVAFDQRHVPTLRKYFRKVQ